MKDKFDQGKSFIKKHRYEIAVGLIAVGAIGALAIVKCLSDSPADVDTLNVTTIEDGPDDTDNTIVEE